MIVRPVAGESEAEYTVLADRVYKLGDAGWYDDEALNAAPQGRMFYGLERLLTEGRTRGISVVLATTRPVGVHNRAISEANHLFAFDLLLEGDRRKLAGFVGPSILAPDLLRVPHSFGYFSPDDGEPFRVYAPVPARG